MAESYKGMTIPEYEDAADGPGAFKSLVDSGPVARFTDASARDVAIPNPVEGQMVYLSDINQFQFWTGSAWQDITTGASPGAHVHAGSDITSGSIPDGVIGLASTSEPGIVQLSTSLTSTSTALAATASAVKALNDKIDGEGPFAPLSHSHSYLPTTGGNVSGKVTVTSGGLRVTGYEGGAQPYTFQTREIQVSDVLPNGSQGKDGDLYIYYDFNSLRATTIFIKVAGVWRGQVS